MTLALQSVFSGLTSGVVIALMGMALVFCYRSSRVVNLAQGETYMGSAMLNSKLVAWGLPFPVAALAGLVLAVVASATLERWVLRPRLTWPVSRIVIVTAGVAIFAEGLAYALLGPDQYPMRPLLNGPALRLHGAVLQQQAALAICVSAALAIALSLFLSRTLIGQALGALAERPVTAGLVGIDSGRLRMGSYAVAGFLGFAAALLVVPLDPVSYNVGLTLTLSGYIAAAVGNMRHIGLTWTAGMGIGLAESFFGTYVNSLMAEPLVLGVLLIGVVAYLARKVRFGGAARA